MPNVAFSVLAAFGAAKASQTMAAARTTTGTAREAVPVIVRSLVPHGRRQLSSAARSRRRRGHPLCGGRWPCGRAGGHGRGGRSPASEGDRRASGQSPAAVPLAVRGRSPSQTSARDSGRGQGARSQANRWIRRDLATRRSARRPARSPNGLLPRAARSLLAEPTALNRSRGTGLTDSLHAFPGRLTTRGRACGRMPPVGGTACRERVPPTGRLRRHAARQTLPQERGVR